MTTPTKRDMLSLSDRAFKIAFFYLMPALFIGGLLWLGWRLPSMTGRAVPPEPASPSAPEPPPKCHYRTGIDVKSGVSVTCLATRNLCVVCSVGECSTFNPLHCPELKP
jgi:hypothetical protein